jgi:hypothetical protein
MLLRSVIKHVNTQNWFAVGLDFAIVVVGVFLGIQIGNWNEERVFEIREQTLLVELRAEISEGIELATIWQKYLAEISNAGATSIAFINSDQPCSDDCWDRIIDFFHASQFISVDLDRSVLDELQRVGLPSSRAIESAITAYYSQGVGVAEVLNERPAYRTLIRELIPHTMLDTLWAGCHDVDHGVESLSRDCATEHSSEELRAIVEVIRANPRVRPTLNHWTSMTNTMGPYMYGAIEAGREAIAAIDSELGKR